MKKRKFELKRRNIEDKDPQDLLRILSKIYPEEKAMELFNKLMPVSDKEEKDDDEH